MHVYSCKYYVVYDMDTINLLNLKKNINIIEKKTIALQYWVDPIIVFKVFEYIILYTLTEYRY